MMDNENEDFWIEVDDYISDYKLDNNCLPSVDELSIEFGLTTKEAEYIISAKT